MVDTARTRFTIDFFPAERIIPLFAYQALLDFFPQSPA
jgi:hypothetical protein